jgi:hypothetical protein
VVEFEEILKIGGVKDVKEVSSQLRSHGRSDIIYKNMLNKFLIDAISAQKPEEPIISNIDKFKNMIKVEYKELFLVFVSEDLD